MRDEESLQIEYSSLFNRQFKDVSLEVKIAFRETRDLFSDNPNNPILRNHTLREKYSGYRSINVTDDWRAIFKIKINKKQTKITFYVLGTHTRLYKK